MSSDSKLHGRVPTAERLAGRRVLTVGGANVEHSFAIDGEFDANAKYSIDPQPRLAGGSSVNHTCRLLAMGIDVQAILPLANGDPMSRVILEALGEAEQTGGASCRRTGLTIRGPGLVTPFSSILRQGASRAVFNEFSPELMSAFQGQVKSQVARAGSSRSRPDVVLIGHVHADRVKPKRGAVGFRGAISEAVLRAPELAHARKYVNFGSAQYELGTKRWDRLLRDHVDVFQLDLREIRRFCRDAALTDLSLESILHWFRERCTVVVSLERFGAIGQLVGSDSPIVAWPYLLDDVVDTTGAGDAMGAGITASMLVDSFVDSGESEETRTANFAAALAFGRSCGAYACKTLGGANECPSLDRLAAFERREKLHPRDSGLTHAVTSHDLFLIDRAFEH